MFGFAVLSFFFFNDTATTEIYTLSLHDALPIFLGGFREVEAQVVQLLRPQPGCLRQLGQHRSEEHTSELQSRFDLVCRLLLEKKKRTSSPTPPPPNFCLPHTPPLLQPLRARHPS